MESKSNVINLNAAIMQSSTKARQLKELEINLKEKIQKPPKNK